MLHRVIIRGTFLGMICLAAGCAQQNKVADNGQKGTYIHARHNVVGSNIPAPNRGGGNSDVAETDLDREQFQSFQAQASTAGMAHEGGGGTR